MTQEDLKRAAGEYTVRFVKDGMVVGLGTGSTVTYFMGKLSERIKEGLDIIGIPTSLATERLAKEMGIRLSNLEEHPEIDLTIDGADEVDAYLNLIKGMGGALIREKIVAKASKTEIVVIDESKLVKILGSRTPVPVEVLPFGWSASKRELEKLGCTARLREVGGKRFISDNGNHILDCKFGPIKDPYELEKKLNHIPGVVDNGLFLDIADMVVVARPKVIEELRRD